MARKPPEVLEMTEMIVLHGDSLNGTDAGAQRETGAHQGSAPREGRSISSTNRRISQVWVGTADREAVLATIEALGFKPDLYRV